MIVISHCASNIGAQSLFSSSQSKIQGHAALEHVNRGVYVHIMHALQSTCLSPAALLRCLPGQRQGFALEVGGWFTGLTQTVRTQHTQKGDPS